MMPNTDREWLSKMADLEDGCEWELGAKRCTHYRLTLEHISTHSLCMETRTVARKALEEK